MSFGLLCSSTNMISFTTNTVSSLSVSIFFSLLLLFKHDTSARQRNNTIHRSNRRQCIQEDMRCECAFSTISMKQRQSNATQFNRKNSKTLILLQFTEKPVHRVHREYFRNLICVMNGPQNHMMYSQVLPIGCVCDIQMINNNNFNKKPN